MSEYRGDDLSIATEGRLGRKESSPAPAPLSWEFYKDIYGGKLIPEQEWAQTAIRALDKVRYYTQDRSTAEYEDGTTPTVEEKYNKAICAVADAWYAGQESIKSVGVGIKSKKIGQWAVTTGGERGGSSQDITQAIETACYDAVFPYLENTGMLSRWACG